MPKLKHAVYDSDTHFSINPKTRALQNESLGKNCVIQYDHNSERITFELPKVIEGHDMMQCDSIQIHYENIDAQTKAKSCGIYEVDDLQVSPDDPEILMLSWLISGNATRYVGALNFLVRLACTDTENNTFIYVWNTAIYTGLSVSSGINNGEAIVEEYPDVLQGWKKELDESMLVSMEQTKTSTASEGVNELTATFGNGETAVFQIRNGAKGDTGLVGSIETVDGQPLHFFAGTRELYKSLPENVRNSGLFSIITDDIPNQMVYNATVEVGSDALNVNVPNFIFKDGAELMVQAPVSQSNDGGIYALLNVNGTGNKTIFTKEVGEHTAEYNAWDAGDVLCFKYSDGFWLLTENLTQHKVYKAAWVNFGIEEYCFEKGKTYQLMFRVIYSQSGLVEWCFTSFFIPSSYPEGVTSLELDRVPFQTSGAVELTFTEGTNGLCCLKGRHTWDGTSYHQNSNENIKDLYYRIVR